MTSLRKLKRILGPMTALLVGLGVTVGSGIFRTPSLVASELGAPWAMIAVWVVGGGFVLLSSFVSAELSTRFPEAGGEYVYLREAYGDFVAFFFGWGYTVFIIGGGAATIAAAAGEALAELTALDMSYASWLGTAIMAAVTAVNAFGLRVGSGLQNILTVVKLLALLGVSGLAFLWGDSGTEWEASIVLTSDRGWATVLVAALPPVLFSYGGTTDAVKLAEEVKDVQRSMPRALIGSAVAITVLYIVVNLAYLWVLTPQQLAASRFAPSDVMSVLFGPVGHRIMTALALVVFVGAASSTVLATVRVPFALARDGLAFSFMGRMSKAQSPTGALVVVGSIACFFTMARGFSEILNIYFLAAAILFGLAYASLLVFRHRDTASGQGFPSGAFRCPMASIMVVTLILIQVAVAALIIVDNPADAAYTLGLLTFFGVAYLGWRKVWPTAGSGSSA